MYRKLAAEDRLPVRVYGMLDGQQPLGNLDAQMRLWKRTPRIGLLTVQAVKLFADGALGSRGAKLFEPYADDSRTTGLWLTAPGELRSRIARVAAAGYQPCVHAIGDRACAETLEAFCAAPGARRLRPRVEHLQVLRPGDAHLLRASGAVASMQPTHATSDAPWVEARLGKGTERQKGAYAWRQALDAGATLAFGSDFPVESLDPRRGPSRVHLGRRVRGARRVSTRSDPGGFRRRSDAVRPRPFRGVGRGAARGAARRDRRRWPVGTARALTSSPFRGEVLPASHGSRRRQAAATARELPGRRRLHRGTERDRPRLHLRPHLRHLRRLPRPRDAARALARHVQDPHRPRGVSLHRADLRCLRAARRRSRRQGTAHADLDAGGAADRAQGRHGAARDPAKGTPRRRPHPAGAGARS